MGDVFLTFASVVGIGAAACGGSIAQGEPTDASSNGSATVEGTVLGQSIPTTTTLALMDGTKGLLVVMNNLDDACADWQAGRDRRQPGVRSFVLAVASAGNQPVGAGTYSIILTPPQAPPYANATYSSLDGTCQLVYFIEPASGTVTLQTVSASLVTGSFDVTLYTGDRVQGTFSAPVCDAPIALDAEPPCGS
jgi:hypothetical protein